MKELECEDFIGIYEDVFPEGYCQFMVEEFERLRREGVVTNRLKSENTPRHIKDDEYTTLNMNHSPINEFKGEWGAPIFFKGLQECFDSYTQRFTILNETHLQANYMKAQRTDPGSGYHVWHHEKTSSKELERVVTYMLYLNTLEEDAAGETEFLYQRKRVRPVENTMVIWPAGYTHPHRGNVVHGTKPKYIITGWFYHV